MINGKWLGYEKIAKSTQKLRSQHAILHCSTALCQPQPTASCRSTQLWEMRAQHWTTCSSSMNGNQRRGLGTCHDALDSLQRPQLSCPPTFPREGLLHQATRFTGSKARRCTMRAQRVSGAVRKGTMSPKCAAECPSWETKKSPAKQIPTKIQKLGTRLERQLGVGNSEGG